LVFRNPLPHFFILRFAGRNIDFSVSGHIFGDLLGVAAFAASASADNKNDFLHLVNSYSKIRAHFIEW
jgi:hypothetical protein